MDSPSGISRGSPIFWTTVFPSATRPSVCLYVGDSRRPAAKGKATGLEDEEKQATRIEIPGFPSIDVESEAFQANVLLVRVDSITQPVRYLGNNAWEIAEQAWVEIRVDGIEVVVHDAATGERRTRLFGTEGGFFPGWKGLKSMVFCPADGPHWLTIGAILTHIQLWQDRG